MNNNKILYEARLYDYPERITVSKKRRAKYFKKEDKIPNKYKTQDYFFTPDGFLIHKTNGRPLKNPRAVGTPRTIKISGQDIWRGISYHTRSAIAKALKKFFYEAIVRKMQPLSVKDYPIGIEMKFFDIIEGEDLNNQEYFYKKSLGDALGGNVDFIKETKDGKTILSPDYKAYPKKIVDDSKQYIQEYITRFVPIKDHDNRSLLIKIYKL